MRHLTPTAVWRTGADVGPPGPGPARTPSMVARRLRLLAALVTSLLATTLIVRVTLLPLLFPELSDSLHARLAWEMEASLALLIVLSVALYVHVGRRLYALDRLDGMALAHLLLVSLAVAAFEATLLPAQGPPWGVSWTVVLVVLYALALPSTPGRTAVGAALATGAVPLAVTLAEGAGAVETTPYTYLSLVIDAALGTFLATAGSWLVYSRRDDVRLELGAYHLEKRIGAGGMGEVWRARHRLLLRPAAVKIVRPDTLAKSAGELDRLILRFEREALATSILESPHTVQLFDFGTTEEGSFYYAMELLEGVDLAELVEQTGPLPAERVVYLLRQICHSLREAHALGIVHRDMKPANVMTCRLGPDYDFIKVCDFGLVKWHQVKSGRRALEITGEGSVAGTPAFMSPEAVTGDHPVGPASDVYSLGCIAYWLLTGRLVFEADALLEMAVRHVNDLPTPPSDFAEGPLPAALETLVLDCLAKDPRQRPRDAAELDRLLTTIPLDRAWTPRRAADWWRLHLPRMGTEQPARMAQASLRPRRWLPRRSRMSDEEDHPAPQR